MELWLRFKTKYRVYVDPCDSPVIAKYKGKTKFDSSSFYAPYVPMQMNEIECTVAQGDLWGWTTFFFYGNKRDVVEWCRENFGRKHRGIYLQGLDLWLGNGGRWRCDHRKEYEVGVRPAYTRIWLHREDDIALFKLRWT